MRIVTDGYAHPPTPHSGEFIRSVYLEPFGMSVRTLAENLGVAPSTLNRVVSGKSGPDMTLRLAKALGRSPGVLACTQDYYDPWQVKQHTDLGNVRHVELASA